MASKMRSALLPLLTLFLATLFVGACSDNETITTAPDGSPLVFTGTIPFQGNSTHDFTLVEDALLSITLAEIRILLFDRTQASPDNLTLGFGIGQRDDEGECRLTTNVLINEGQVQVYRLARDTYCLSMFDAGALPEDAVVGYELQGQISL